MLTAWFMKSSAISTLSMAAMTAVSQLLALKHAGQHKSASSEEKSLSLQLSETLGINSHVDAAIERFQLKKIIQNVNLRFLVVCLA